MKLKIICSLGLTGLLVTLGWFWGGFRNAAANRPLPSVPTSAPATPLQLPSPASPASDFSGAPANAAAAQVPPASTSRSHNPDRHGPFGAFDDWAWRFQQVVPSERAKLEAEGQPLARARLQALADLIQTDPEQALREALPDGTRQSLPATIQPLLETPINTRGAYEVYCVKPVEEGRAPGMVRLAWSDGHEYLVFTYGEALEFAMRPNLPIHGIAVPIAAASKPPVIPSAAPTHLLALDPNPARLLGAGEVAGYFAGQPTEPRCIATGEPCSVHGDPAVVQLGGVFYPFSRPALGRAWAAEAVAGEHLEAPPASSEPQAAGSPRTEGRKRFMVFRVDFPDYPGEVMTTNQALTLMTGLSNFMAEVSDNQLIVAPVGQGSTITPTMRLPNAVESYQNMGTFLDACWVAAGALGQVRSDYDYWYVCTAGKPSASFAGLGYVGSEGFWLANRYWDVRTCAHEFGHNLNLYHANWWNTSGRSMLGEGSSEEYGDPFDTMGGSGGGIRHFSAYNKNRTDWIPDADCPQITRSGRYRLYAHDLGVPVGVRGLWFDRPSGGDYWLEFRQRWTANKSLMNGVSLRWAGGSTTLLDFNPGSTGGKDDHAITIGRTFSDTNVNLHITPIGKGFTYPESMDLVINVGPFPNNQPPSVVARASTTSGSSGQTLRFVATATDADGDDLAYAWDFGDGDYSVDNSATTTHVFGNEGEYVVHCAVSDMRGGLGLDALVVRINNPVTASIRGRVLLTNGVPLVGAKVSVNAALYAFTESDGSYTLSQLDPGTYTVTASEPIQGAFKFATPFWTNPVTVPPNVITADFIAFTEAAVPLTPLVEKQSEWKYLDDGSDQGAAWMLPGFDDTAWSSGRGVLGYPSSEVRTLLSYGSDADEKHPTYYFRQRFNVATPGAFTNLQLEVLRDDGVILYLNGAELFRNNMPAGPVTYTDLASTTVSGSDETLYVTANLNPAGLVAGDNVLAAEVHQAAPDSSDIAFDLALGGQSATNQAGMNLVYVAYPENHQVIVTPLNLGISATALCKNEAVSRVDFYADGAWLSSDTNLPYTQFWFQPALGPHLLYVVATFASGFQLKSPPVQFTVAANPPTPLTQSLVATGAVWKFFAGPSGAPAGWAARTYDDSSWPGGPAELGYGDDPPDEATIVPYGGNGAAKWITTCFRHAFILNDPAVVTNLILQLKRDDGVILYLNGQEVLRDEMPAGAVSPQTLASRAVLDDGKNFNPFYLDPTALLSGTNVLAAEIHQSAPNSSDLSFDAALEAWIASNRPPGLWLTSPAHGTIVSLPATVTLRVQAVTAGTTEIVKVAFFDGEVNLGEDTSQPFAWDWNNPGGGWHTLTAVATDTAGGSHTSAPVTLIVTAPPLSRALVSFGEVWRYWDSGSDPGPDWAEASFADQLWKAGPARLGYGGDGEATTVSFGPDPGARYVTTYFRRRFANDPAAPLSSLRLRLVRDDGAVVYLNGMEVFRNNLQAGPVSFHSLATNTVGGADETTPLEVVVPATALNPGANVIAVEMHQAATTSTDLGFDLELTGLTATNTVNGIYLVSPPAGAHFTAPAVVPLTAYAHTPGAITRLEYFEGAAKRGDSVIPPYTFAWSNPPLGSHSITAVATYGNGLQMTSGPVAFAVEPPPAPIAPVAQTFIPSGAEWMYWDSADPVAFNWQKPEFDDRTWPAGWARFGWGLDGELTPLTAGRVTHYFRRWFTANEPATLTDLVFQLVRDDGAVVYLNGQEVFRSNLPAGALTPNTPAVASVDPPNETRWFETVLPTVASGVGSGSNLIAVELHQGGATSSDAGFDFALMASGTTERRIYLATPTANVQLSSLAPVWLEAMAQPAAGATVVKVEFFIDGVKAGESLTAPYRYAWPSPAFGPHELLARQTDSRGVTLDAAPRIVVVSPEPIASSFIVRNSVWRFLDTGVNLGTAWKEPAFDDGTWSGGPARLGYGDDGEVTVVGYGPNAEAKYVTTYFRRKFVVPPGAVYTNLMFQLQRDDGAVVWLNGVEAFRSNMPGSGVNDLTPASAAVSGTDEQAFFPTTVAAAPLVAGTNVVAVEIHQINSASSDLAFDLELIGQGYVNIAFVPALTLTVDDGYVEVSWPATPAGWQLYYASEPQSATSAWSPVPVAPVTASGRHVVTLPPNGSKEFFRLVKP